MLYVLLIIAGLLSWFALKNNRVFVLGFLAGAAWFLVMAYVAEFPPGGLTKGDTIHSMLLIVLAGAAVIIPLASIRLGKSKEYNVTAGIIGGGEDDEAPRLVATVRESRSMRHGVASNFNESPEEYQAKVRKMLHPPAKHHRR
ncbi:hypothetical protein LCGC14_1211250 [marine sediment metagenome]|uniref:Uncharacterized protein n=1 Tax=marine sediment metagenome TaxID=412755 RepID=A0A0F9M1D5_9ZZZZ